MKMKKKHKTVNSEKGTKEIHITWLTTLWRCGEQFRRRYIKGEIIPPPVALIVGQATHKSVEYNISHKIKTGKLVHLDEVEDIAAESVKKLWTGGVKLDDEYTSIRKAKGQAIDEAVLCAKNHYKYIAPDIIKPVRVEDSFTFKIENSKFKIKGTTDIEEEFKNGIRLRDTKTANKRPPIQIVDTNIQLTMYALKILKQTGKLPKEVSLDYIIKGKTGEKSVCILRSKRNIEDIKILLNRIDASIKQIEAGIFPPANPENWICSERFCGYWRTCPYRSRI